MIFKPFDRGLWNIIPPGQIKVVAGEWLERILILFITSNPPERGQKRSPAMCENNQILNFMDVQEFML